MGGVGLATLSGQKALGARLVSRPGAGNRRRCARAPSRGRGREKDGVGRAPPPLPPPPPPPPEARPPWRKSSGSVSRRHAKRSTINTEDVKLLARRSNSLLNYITKKSEELALNNLEQKEKKKKKPGKGRKISGGPSEAMEESVDQSNKEMNICRKSRK
uniref:Centromere protein S n=1 Tax=Ornithorhynchus anatinus TaxID=9258 RepID=A0A6I8MZX1_ORNAN